MASPAGRSKVVLDAGSCRVPSSAVLPKGVHFSSSDGPSHKAMTAQSTDRTSMSDDSENRSNNIQRLKENIPTPDPNSTSQRNRIAAAVEDAAEVAVDAGIVGVAAALGTAGIIHDAIRFEESTSGALVLEAGAALLEAFEHVPFVAPAAFLVRFDIVVHMMCGHNNLLYYFAFVADTISINAPSTDWGSGEGIYGGRGIETGRAGLRRNDSEGRACHAQGEGTRKPAGTGGGDHISVGRVPNPR